MVQFIAFYEITRQKISDSIKLKPHIILFWQIYLPSYKSFLNVMIYNFQKIILVIAMKIGIFAAVLALLSQTTQSMQIKSNQHWTRSYNPLLAPSTVSHKKLSHKSSNQDHDQTTIQVPVPFTSGVPPITVKPIPALSTTVYPNTWGSAYPTTTYSTTTYPTTTYPTSYYTPSYSTDRNCSTSPVSVSPVSVSPVSVSPVSVSPVSVSPVSVGLVSTAPVSTAPVQTYTYSIAPVTVSPVSVSPVSSLPVSTIPSYSAYSTAPITVSPVSVSPTSWTNYNYNTVPVDSGYSVKPLSVSPVPVSTVYNPTYTSPTYTSPTYTTTVVPPTTVAPILTQPTTTTTFATSAGVTDPTKIKWSHQLRTQQN